FSIVLDGRVASILGAIVSLILLLLNSYAKNFNLIDISLDHKIASDKLWKIREEYVSLLTDFDCLEREEIIKRRDNLQQRTHEVYVGSPRTDMKSFTDAQIALKNNEEQTFTENEIDIMLPNSIRRSYRESD
ncbi:MAG: SLATT domain-containing protein, partial [Erysipelotrichaceae bacterium]